jgi:hypothetical protein|tara:strand:+ start:110 stop:838 length:729 start_codon:yes stop_codon:yes gene_type:complete
MDTLTKLRDDAQYYGAFGKQFLSNSDVGSLLSNPKEFKVDRPDNPNFAKGRYFHQLILEPEKALETEFVDVSTRTTKIYKEFIKERDISFALLTKEGEELRDSVKIMMGNLDMYELIANADNEYEVPAVSEIKGVMWKGKADIVHPDMLIDLKTTSKIDDFKWSARKYNYDSQCYIYQELFGKPLIFLVIDKTSGMLGHYVPSEEFVNRGEEKVDAAIKVYEKFFGENSIEDINSYYIHEIL